MIRRRRKADPVTPALRELVLFRDNQCIAAYLDPAHECRDQFGWPHSPARLDVLTLDHVQSEYGRMGKRAASDPSHLVSLCYHAHLNGWATSHRPALRVYLEEANAA